jgi:hypothetical protein
MASSIHRQSQLSLAPWLHNPWDENLNSQRGFIEKGNHSHRDNAQSPAYTRENHIAIEQVVFSKKRDFYGQAEATR